MDPRAAVDGQRLHHQWLPDRASIEGEALDPAALDRLRAMGHEIRVGGRWSQGDAHTIWIDPVTSVAYGAADPRSTASRASVPPAP